MAPNTSLARCLAWARGTPAKDTGWRKLRERHREVILDERCQQPRAPEVTLRSSRDARTTILCTQVIRIWISSGGRASGPRRSGQKPTVLHFD
ncbi:MAG: hypothetical protein ACXVCX_11310 [Ktedonobacterales bacterium]